MRKAAYDRMMCLLVGTPIADLYDPASGKLAHIRHSCLYKRQQHLSVWNGNHWIEGPNNLYALRKLTHDKSGFYMRRAR